MKVTEGWWKCGIPGIFITEHSQVWHLSRSRPT